MSRLTLRDWPRAGHVTRWQIVRTARHQTLAEHLYIVAMLAHRIYMDICPNPTTQEELMILRWALVHDRPEIMTGDIATPLKTRIRSMVASGMDPIRSIETEIDDEYANIYERIAGTRIEVIVKIADLQEGISFLTVEGLGSHAVAVRKKLIEKHTALVDEQAAINDGWRWKHCKSILHELIAGPDGTLDQEQGA